WLLGMIRSDVWGGPTFESPFYEDLIRNNISASNVPFGGWGNFYGRIHQVNDFIENIPEIKDLNEDEKNHYMGEAYGIRAFYYYTMLKTWGRVPITTEAFKGEATSGLSKERAPKKEVMSLIKDDIQR